MTHFGITVDIAAPPDRVWAVLSDIERWPEWTPTVRRVTRLDQGPLTIGSRVRIRQPGLPPAAWQITELVEGRRFTWVTRSPGVRVVAQHGVESTPPGTRATLSLEFSGVLGPVIGWLTRRINQRYLALEAKGLSERSASPAVTAPGAP